MSSVKNAVKSVVKPVTSTIGLTPEVPEDSPANVGLQVDEAPKISEFDVAGLAGRQSQLARARRGSSSLYLLGSSSENRGRSVLGG